MRRSFRIVAMLLAAYFWWLGVGAGLYIGASSGALDNWGGGLRFLTNWVLTLNLLIAIDSMILEVTHKRRYLSSMILATMTMNIVVIALYWGMRSIDQSLLDVDTEGWTLFQWFWDFYVHWGMALILFAEAMLLNRTYKKLAIAYGNLLIIFFGYILWIEAFVSRYSVDPCGALTCGFPYPFLNDLNGFERTIFYSGVCLLGTLGFVISRWLSGLTSATSLNEGTPT